MGTFYTNITLPVVGGEPASPLGPLWRAGREDLAVGCRNERRLPPMTATRPGPVGPP
jgi:hypothetical protein